jgi:hypothetical protein
MLSARRFRPFLTTLVLFSAMVFTWIHLLGDLGEASEALAPLLIIGYAGLVGVYGATVALRSHQPENPARFLFSVFVRTAAVGGAAILFARILVSES